ncbi:MAG: hypothetical protein HOO94_03165 [Novosphingobium sp.]|uniref:hypothetical protein n=1 Tax=Novosphingobium sp. TaxID=1874826 RepID=UPI001809E81A|nr:hypothetical protein [Novosphingobium sp.]
MTRSKIVSRSRLVGLVAAGCLFALSGCSETPDTEEVAKAKAAAERAEDAAARAEQAAKMISGGTGKPSQQVAVNDDTGDSSGSDETISPVVVNDDGTVDGADLGPPAHGASDNRE